MKPIRLLVLLAIALAVSVSASRAASTAYYVAPDGNDANPGTLAAPFRTIQKCAEVATTGDTCFIRAGVYRETVRPARSGTADAPITFKPYNDEQVIISGADVVAGPWTLHSGAIYRTALGWNLNVRTPTQVTNNQIWVDGLMMPEARWPNVPLDRVTHFTNADKAQAEGVRLLSTYSAVYTDTALAAFAPGAWVGGKINFGPGYSLIHTTCDVTASTSAAVTFVCNPDPGAYNARTQWDLDDTMLRPAVANYYYLWGKLSALDAPGEWFYDDATGTLYLWLPDGAAPAAHTIEAKRRLWAFDLAGRSYITLEGLHIFGASIRTDANAHHLTLQALELRYLWHFQQIPPLFYTNGTYGIEFRGNDNVLRDSTLAYSAAELVKLSGLRNVAENNVLYDMGYMGSAVGVSGAAYQQSNPGGADRNTLRQNTLFNAGRYPVQADPGLDILTNDLYNSHLQIMDVGVIYSWGTDGKNAAIAYNWVHDNAAELNPAYHYWGGHGIYLDDDTYNYLVYRNIVWNTTSPGIFMYGVNGTVIPELAGQPSNRYVFNNTVDGEIAADAKGNYGGLPQALSGTVFINNIGTQVDLSNPALVAHHNLAGDPLYVNRAARDYALRPYSPAVEAGADVGSPALDAPMEPVGLPDLGALEYGRQAWVAGALIRPQDVAALTVSCQPQADGVTARCTVANLPLGRKLPLDFAVRIGDGPPAGCVNQPDYSTHIATGVCVVSTAGLSDTQPVALRLPPGDWRTAGAVDLRPLALTRVSPAWTLPAGGARLTLEGRRFALGPTGYTRPITLTNATGRPLYAHPTLVTLNTAELIAAGKLRADCGDLRFYDEYGALPYWLEDGCNTTATRLWVKVNYLPAGASAIILTYGNARLASASDGAATFTFFDDFADGVVDPRWTLQSGSFFTLQETGGQMRLTGQTSDANKYQPAGFYLNLWQLTLPADFAFDSELTVVTGPASFKAGLGTALNLQGMGSGGKNISYWDGSKWNVVGTSTINSGTFSSRKFSIGVSGTPTRTLRWRENGALNTVQATWTTPDPSIGHFTYSPDAVAAFDARFDNIRIRPYAFPEPTSTAGAERPVGVRVRIGEMPCADIIVEDATRLTCTAPPHAVGCVDVTITNPDGQSDTLSHGLCYRVMVYLPLALRH